MNTKLPLAEASRAPQAKPYHWSQDALASVVVFFVALPLCMGIALASGAPIAAGLITGIIGGLVTGALSGCPLQVSGPAAGLTVIVYELGPTVCPNQTSWTDDEVDVSVSDSSAVDTFEFIGTIGAGVNVLPIP